jgi:hippurate hydrolase
MASTLHEAGGLAADLSELRHRLHRQPEIGLRLPRTQELIVDQLKPLGLEISTGSGLDSVTAVLRGGGSVSRKTVLLRADMDALPVTERTGVPFASTVDGAMHACGHDLHVTMLLGAARLIAARRERLGGDVVLMFQPGEEGPGGARPMLEEGLLEASGSRPAAAYALHVDSSAELGTVVSRPGPLMASCDTLRVTVRGRGGHGSAPHEALDPVPVACEMVLALQTHVTRAFDSRRAVVLTVGSLRAGTADNIIPDEARFEATVRCVSDQDRERLAETAPHLCRKIAEAHGLDCDAELTLEYPVTSTDPAETEFASGVARRLLADEIGPGAYTEAALPRMGAEDFSFVLREVPGSFLHLGAKPPGAPPRPMHSAEAVFDDRTLPLGAALLTELATERLDFG